VVVVVVNCPWGTIAASFSPDAPGNASPPVVVNPFLVKLVTCGEVGSCAESFGANFSTYLDRYFL
jgi:hypothetical protein